jgi:hypothetical protein
MQWAVSHLRSGWLAAGNVVERVAEIIVLAEDLRQGNLVRHYLVRCGHHGRSIVLRLAPRGRGSGEQYVRERYPIEVAYYRQRSHFRKAALSVVLDADVGSVEEHERELAAALTAANASRREDDETICVLIPKRNVETWILCLFGEVVSEVENYKGRAGIDGMIRLAAGRLYEWSRDGAAVPDSCVPSLRKGLGEVRRAG